MATGGCLCGAVRYRLLESSQGATHCHCGMCRKQHGAAFATYAMYRRQAVEIEDPSAALSEFRSSARVLRGFCRMCGSSLFWRREDRPEGISVALGTLDGEPDREPQAHIFVKSKASWTRICDDLPQHE